LKKKNVEIEDHIDQIRKICEDSNTRTRSKSEFLRKKMEEARAKKSLRESLDQILVKS
jgi:hypothetical protein